MFWRIQSWLSTENLYLASSRLSWSESHPQDLSPAEPLSDHHISTFHLALYQSASLFCLSSPHKPLTHGNRWNKVQKLTIIFLVEHYSIARKTVNMFIKPKHCLHTSRQLFYWSWWWNSKLKLVCYYLMENTLRVCWLVAGVCSILKDNVSGLADISRSKLIKTQLGWGGVVAPKWARPLTFTMYLVLMLLQLLLFLR